MNKHLRGGEHMTQKIQGAGTTPVVSCNPSNLGSMRCLIDAVGCCCCCCCAQSAQRRNDDASMQTCTRVSKLPTPSAVGAGLRASVSPSTTSTERQTPLKERFRSRGRRKGATEETETAASVDAMRFGSGVLQLETLCFPSLVSVCMAHTRPPTHTQNNTHHARRSGNEGTHAPTRVQGEMIAWMSACWMNKRTSIRLEVSV